MIKVFPNLDDQAASMESDFPQMRLVSRDASFGVWKGALRPFFQEHLVEVFYRVPLVVERLDLLRLQPRVRVIDPPLISDASGSLPHVYWPSDEGDPLLCLFSPELREWTPFDLLSRTTIPFTIDWLACYEGWRATGEWTGGGRHPEPLDGDAS